MTGETETRLTETVSAQVTEEIEITVTEGLDGPADEAGGRHAQDPARRPRPGTRQGPARAARDAAR